MKRLFFLFVIVIVAFSNLEKASASMCKTRSIESDFNKTFVGTINQKIDVVFSLKSINGKITGFYYYNKIGVEISLTGEVNNGNVVLYELDYQSIKRAKITGQLLKNTFYGKWEDLSTRKSFPIQLQISNKSIPPLPDTLIGIYKFANGSSCHLTIEISKSKGLYYYHFKSPVRALQGKVTFSRSLDENLVYINFNRIEWEENGGDIPKSLPTSVGGLLSDNEITIQNYGNAMNSYVKLGECSDEKYIQLKKNK